VLRVAGAMVGLLALVPSAMAAAPLLDRAVNRAPFVAFCEGPNGDQPRAGDTPLPVDPRKLVNEHLKQPGTAAYFNASWIDVHTAEGMRRAPTQYPNTCGEFRTAAKEGKDFLYSRSMFFLLGSTDAYQNLWKVWGLDEKPADFEQQVLDRYGFNEAPMRNPYPLPGEDPAATNGGSGQLPLGLVQGVDESTGKYNGQLTISCAACHDSILGTKEDGLGWYPGRGSDKFDASLFGSELSQAESGPSGAAGGLAFAAIPFPFSAGRGLSDAFGLIDVLGAMYDMETLDLSPGAEVFPAHGSAGQVQTPNWWNASHRARMFLQGELSRDNTRVSMALAVANFERGGAQTKAMEPKFEQVKVFLDSLSPPQYPKEIDTALAEEGAVLFHEKNLWADGRNASIPKQVGGNGSCSSCHGVYSPRYANDLAYLPDPRLKGIEANIVPIETILTDPARTNLASGPWRRAWNTSWWGYDELNPTWTPDGQGRAGTTFERVLYDYSLLGDRVSGPNVWTDEPKGYEAPPLYGAWASAPYFHNGSVPTIRDVLRPDQRPAVWRRPLTKPSSSGIQQGLDASFAGYDFDKLGYKYDRIPCNEDGADYPVVPCTPKGSPLSIVQGQISKALGGNAWLANQSAPPMDENDRQRRMIMNANEYSLGNGGHVFARALSDHEVDAILEYLKTL